MFHAMNNKVARRAFGLRDDNPYSHFSLNVLNLSSLGLRIGEDTEET